jgi:hypothetical protein
MGDDVDGIAALARATRVLWRRTEGGVVVLVPGDDEFIHLTGTGVAVWDALVVPRTRHELARLLANSYRADPVDVAGDVAPVIDQLVGRRVLEEQPA